MLPNTPGNTTGFRFKKIHTALVRTFNNNLRAYDLTYSQINVLSFLRSEEAKRRAPSALLDGDRGVTADAEEPKGVPLKSIEQALVLSHPTVIGLVVRLEQKGLVTTAKNPLDARSRLVCLTQKARGVAQMHAAHREHIESLLVSGLSGEEVAALNALLDKVIANLQTGENIHE